MTNSTNQSSIRVFWLILLVALWSLGLKAQVGKNPKLTWDQEVGCVERLNEKGQQENYTLYEQIRRGICVSICEDSQVTYHFSANRLAGVSWEVTGGTIIQTQQNDAIIKWGAAGNGTITLTVTYTDNTTETLIICVDKIKGPKANFNTKGLTSKDSSFCVNTPIIFENNSTNNGGSAIINYLWDFGDGNYSNAFEPTHAYEAEGEYIVNLTVTNSCNCTSQYKIPVYIKGVQNYEIYCPSVVCEGSIETYTSSDACGGEWKIEGGTIVNQTETSVDVKWDRIDYKDGFGYVSYYSNCSCPNWTTVKIPVVTNKAIITGPEMICQNSQDVFTLPQWPTTEFEWAINGDPYHPMLVRTDQRNEIVVSGHTPGIYTLSVKYNNTLIDDGECKGTAEIKFQVAPRPRINTTGSLTLCPSTPKNFSLSNGGSSSWTITHNNQTVYTATGSTMQYNFPNPGTYMVTANTGGCQTDPVLIEVIDNGSINGSIDGPKTVCLNTPYTYTVTEDAPGYIYTWTITNGSFIGSNSGKQIDVKFVQPGTLSVVKTKVQNGVTCSSSPISMNVGEALFTPVIINDSGLEKFCPSSTATFTLSIGDVDPDHITWSIQGNSGNTNFGNIIEGINSKVVTVGFNNISSSGTGTLKVVATKCGRTQTATYPIVLIPEPTLTLAPIAPLCSYSSTIELNLTATTITEGSIRIRYDDKESLDINAYFQNGRPNIIPNKFKNKTSETITKTITIFYENCHYKKEVKQTVDIYPFTELNIAPSYLYFICPEDYQPFDIHASFPAGREGSQTYKWYKNGVLTGVTTSNYTVSGSSPIGRYQVESIDINGCIAKSAEIRVLRTCPPPTECEIVPNPNVRLTASWTVCGEINANLSFNGTPDEITWGWTHDLQQNYLAPDSKRATFTTEQLGKHQIFAYVRYGSCTVFVKTEIIKQFIPDFKTSISCNPDGTYTIQLTDDSEYDPFLGATGVTAKYTGTTISGALVGRNHILTVPAGTYEFTLTLSALRQADCSITKSITIDPVPNPNFILSPLNYCADDKILLNLHHYNPKYTYEWFFNGTSYNASSLQTAIQIPEKGLYPITLKIVTPYGCTYESSNDIRVQINKASFKPGKINPVPANFCATNATPLSFTVIDPTSSTLTDIIWMYGNQEAGHGLTYQPVHSGTYWPVLIDQNGCKDYSMVEKAILYELRQPPFAEISGKTNLCFSENTVLTGIATDPNVQFRWSGPNVPANLTTWSNLEANKTLTLNGLPIGTYNYTFQTRIPTDASCINSVTANVQVNAQVAIPTISYTQIDCNPYTLRLTASGPNTGTYLWSNGMSGKTITVYHGGAYSVTYTETTGCSQTGYVQAPHSPERSLWIVPQGCYTVCKAYLLGPLGEYHRYNWQRNGVTTQIGNNGFIPNQPINSGGIYQLILTQQGCTYYSNMPNIIIDPRKCKISGCSMKIDFRYIEKIEGGIRYYVTIGNGTGIAQTIHLSSGNGYGTFVPATHPISTGTTSFYVDFYVNGTYSPGVIDDFIISGTNCTSTFPTKLDGAGPIPHGFAIPSLILSPNPTTDITYATYNIGSSNENAQYLVVYDLLGVQRYKQKISDRQAEVALEINHLAQGTYLISLEADGKRIATEKLIKK